MWLRLIKHRLHDDQEARRLLAPAALARIGEHVAASEARHTGQIRVFIEAGLPWSYLRRHATPRDRAVAMFGKLGVWDTERNNGVLIYLLLAEHAIEIVADRGLAARVDARVWQRLADDMKAPFAEGRFEDGLLRAVDEVGALLATHFPRAPGAAALTNELPDEPIVRR